MKKLLSLALASFLFLLSACGSSGTEGSKPFDPSGATKAMVDAGAFSVPLEELDAALLYDFDGYGMDPDQLESAIAFTASGYTEQVSVTVWKTDADAKAAVAAFGEYLQDMKDTYASYAPLEVDKLGRAIVKQRGNSVLLVVPADAEAAQAAVDKLG